MYPGPSQTVLASKAQRKVFFCGEGVGHGGKEDAGGKTDVPRELRSS